MAINFLTVHCFAQEDMALPYGVSGNFKCYIDYRKITDTNSIQYKLQEQSTTDDKGFRRYNDLYMIGIGTFYTEIPGTEFEIELDTGIIINCIAGDIRYYVKDYTDELNQYVLDNESMIEFIVDIDCVDEFTLESGDMSNSGFKGKITRITKIKAQEGG